MKLFEIKNNIVAVYVDDTEDVLLIFNCDKSIVKNHIINMIKDNVESYDENYTDVIENIDGLEAFEKFLKKKNIYSVKLDSLINNGLNLNQIAKSMPKFKGKK